MMQWVVLLVLVVSLMLTLPATFSFSAVPCRELPGERFLDH